MSHTVTITRTTTSNTGTAVLVNTGFLGSTPGLLKLAQLLLGAACVGVVGYYIDRFTVLLDNQAHLFFLVVAVACLVGTFCLFLSCVISFATASIISKTIYEVIYHGLAFILYLAAGLTLIIKVNEHKNMYKRYGVYEPYLAASIMGLVLAALYLLGTVLANRTYRGI
ncbi:MARVEL domain-containing protein 1 isoform X1 [Hyposmocoma kahamanoa]|uniref:MARVEL domain-containing protein 1 isoform X1 n=1 Tax=Hyposmocoma kahamanoa TaxID=1477025 RepID=UPI000E6D6287|nr:MARVEL domain-containing protein 1 isoform X1 [Hyposmocoma kahamanoa]